MTEKRMEPDKELMEKFVQEAMRLGNIELDVIPTDKTQSLEDVMKQFAEFAKLMKDLHGDTHLTALNVTDSNAAGMRGMFE